MRSFQSQSSHVYLHPLTLTSSLLESTVSYGNELIAFLFTINKGEVINDEDTNSNKNTLRYFLIVRDIEVYIL